MTNYRRTVVLVMTFAAMAAIGKAGVAELPAPPGPAFAAPPAAPGGPSGPSGLEVWTLTSLERAMRDTLPGPAKAAVLRAARNEWESFQIAVRGSNPMRIVDVAPGSFRGPSGALLSVDSFRLHREHQLLITRPTNRNENFRKGWYPDALIPFHNPITWARLKGGRFEAVPFDLPSGETHAFWIDVYVPADAMPGKYAGAFNVVVEDQGAAAVPVEIEVWDFALPARAAMFTEFGSPADRMRRYYADLRKKGTIKEEPDYQKILRQCAQLMTEHRLNCPFPPDLLSHKKAEDGSFQLTEEQIDGMRQWAAQYHVNAVPVRPPSSEVKDPVADRQRIHSWLRSWDKALEAAGLGNVLCYTYLRDEPNDKEAYEFVQRWGKVMRESGSRVKALVVEQTKTQDESWGNLYGAVDIWVPLFSLHDPETARQRQALGEQIWTYTALCQGEPTPWWHTDFPLHHYRVPAWIAWRHEMKGLLYWGGLSHWSHVEDPWTDPATYQPGDRSLPIEKRRIFNGEGLLVYPARDVGFDGIVPSMRLKALRDGLEDFDYLALLGSRGLRDKALEIVAPVGGSFYKWANDPQEYFKARERLAALLVEKK